MRDNSSLTTSAVYVAAALVIYALDGNALVLWICNAFAAAWLISHIREGRGER